MDPENTESNENVTAAQQAAEAPNVATSGATDNPTADTEHVHETEREAEQAEHQERRENAQLPDPGQPQQNQAATDQQVADVPDDQLASDGDAVVEGLPDEDQAKEAPSSEA